LIVSGAEREIVNHFAEFHGYCLHVSIIADPLVGDLHPYLRLRDKRVPRAPGIRGKLNIYNKVISYEFDAHGTAE
jgi:hypothetical protein